MNANFSGLQRDVGVQGFLLSASLPISLQNTFIFNTCNMILSFKRVKKTVENPAGMPPYEI